MVCAKEDRARRRGVFMEGRAGGNRRAGRPTHHRPSTYLFRVFGTQALPSPEAERNYTGLANALLADVLFDSKKEEEEIMPLFSEGNNK